LTTPVASISIAAVDDDGDLDPREAARVRRRDHDAEAERRELLRPGLGKVFKQIGDSWEHDATRPPKPAKPKRPKS
jgi:hypothetical protein